MLLFISFILFCTLIIYVSFRYYILPKRRFQFYSNHLKKLGYKVYELPFSFFAAPFFDKYVTYFNSHGDSLYLQKNVFPQYDIILSNVLDTVCITVQSLSLVKKFYEPESVFNFVKHPTFSEGIKMSFGQGIFFSQKQAWKRKRKIISKAFNFELLMKNIPIIAKISDETMEQIQDENMLNKKDDESFEFQPRQLGFRIFSRVMMRCFFQTQFKNNQINKMPTHRFLESLFQELNQLSGGIIVILFGSLTYKLGLTESHRKFKNKLAILQRQLALLIEQKVEKFKLENQQIQSNEEMKIQKQTKNKSCDLIQKLLEQKLKGQESYDSKELLEQFCTFLIAGTDTTTNFLRSMMFYLCKYPEIQNKLRIQIEEHIKNQKDFENIETLKKLTYLECIQNEVIRMAGPSATCFIRIVENDMEFENIQLKKGTGIFIQSFANHFNQKYFPQPHVFKPQRWIQNKNYIVPYSYTGFFGGPRTCIGKHLAYLQSKIALIKLLKKYKQISISLGGQRMEVRFLYGPQKYLLKVRH